MVTQERLRELYVYERRGMLRRVVGGRKPYAWRKSGKGYLAGYVDGEAHYLHRLIWLYHKGYMPTRIDHKDGDITNNRIGNLRECTNAQNQYNSKIKCHNRSGAKGVVFHKICQRRPWQAKIVVDGRTISLGYYATVDEAAAAYAAGARKYARKFARPDRRC